MSNKQSAPRLSPRLLLNPIHFFALGFGAGLSPWAPGTAGTLIAIPLIMFIASFGWYAHVFAALIICISGVFICGSSARRLGVHDHPAIVWDEVGGFAITMLWVPVNWMWLSAGFVLFRLLDIVKPWPIREADHRLKGGLGIMLDDIMAGLFSAVMLYALHRML